MSRVVTYQALEGKNIVRRPGGGWNSQNHHMLALLGVAKTPIAGMPPRDIQGVKVWVNSLADAKAKGEFHRIRCECPYCKRDLSVGRLHQHVVVCKEDRK